VEEQLVALQARLDEAEEYAKRESRRMSNKLETRCSQIEEELEMERSKEQVLIYELRDEDVLLYLLFYTILQSYLVNPD
jgi:hypothetical protein